MSRVILIPDEGMGEDEKEYLRKCFNGQVDGREPCRWCGGLHYRECPRIKHITYHPNDDRTVREVEFWPDGEWDKSVVIWPEEVV